MKINYYRRWYANFSANKNNVRKEREKKRRLFLNGWIVIESWTFESVYSHLTVIYHGIRQAIWLVSTTAIGKHRFAVHTMYSDEKLKLKN